MSGRSVWPAAPVADLIRARAHETGGYRAVARRVADRSGVSYHTADRQLARILVGSRLTLDMADRWACALGSHVGELYGWEAYADTA